MEIEVFRSMAAFCFSHNGPIIVFVTHLTGNEVNGILDTK